MGTALNIVRANYEARQKLMEELRSIDEAAEGRAYDTDETTAVAEKRSALESIDSRIAENLKAEIRSQEIGDATGSMLQLMNDGQNKFVDERSMGEKFVQSDGFGEWVGSARGSYAQDYEMDFRAVTNVTTGLTSGGALRQPTRLSRIGQDFIDRKVYLLDLITRIPISTGTVEYVQDKTPLADLANASVEVTEGSAKPQAGPTLAVITEATATIAAWANMTRQAAADFPQVQAYLDNRLRYSIKRRSDIQLINGNGTAPNLTGLINRSGILTYAPGAAEARYKSIRHSIRLMEDVEQVPEIIVLNPADAEIFDLSNDTTAGLHAVDAQGGITGPVSRTAWGLTQVHSTAIPSGTAIVIDPTAVAIFDRQQVTAFMTDSHSTNFTSNLLTLLVEARLGLGLFNPTGVLKCTFNGTV